MPWRKSSRIIISIASVLIGFLFVILLRVHTAAGKQTQPTDLALPNLLQIEQENQQLSSDIDKLRQQLAKYQEGQNASNLAAQQLKEARMNAGLTEVSGPGIRITLNDSAVQSAGSDDPYNYVIHEEYIRELVNILWNGGAEAIAVNNQRITTSTEIFCSGSYIQINGTRQMPPYVIEAIGNQRNLQSALQFYYWDLLGNYQQEYGITRTLEIPSQPLTLPPGKLVEYKYAEPLKEGQ